MKTLAILLAGACLVAGARANTFAEALLTHMRQSLVTDAGEVVLRDEDLDIRLRVDTDTWMGDALFYDVSVSAGQTLVTVFDYTITLSNEGLPYPGPRPGFCTPVLLTTCVEPNGAEGTFAQIVVGARDGRNANPFLDVTEDEVTLIEAGSGGGQLFQSGQLTSTVRLNDPSGIPDDTLAALVFVNVFTTAVPEVSTWASLLFGLFLLGATKVRPRTCSTTPPARWRRGGAAPG
jgi:hypothetical protein